MSCRRSAARARRGLPRRLTPPLLCALLVVVAALAGCTGDDGYEERDDRSPGTGRDVDGDPTLDDENDAAGGDGGDGGEGGDEGGTGNGSNHATNADDDAAIAFSLTSPAFTEGKAIPSRYACTAQGGTGTNPPLEFGSIPDDAVSLALVVDDPDAPSGTWVHWVLWGLGPDTRSIQEGTDPRDLGATVGTNSAGETEYAAPCPPEGTGTHHYSFRLYALDITPGLEEGADKENLENVMEGHIIDLAELTGTYAYAA